MACVCRHCNVIFEPLVYQCPLCQRKTETDGAPVTHYERIGYRRYNSANALDRPTVQAAPLNAPVISPEDSPPMAQPVSQSAQPASGPTPAERLTHRRRMILRIQDMFRTFRPQIPWHVILRGAAVLIALIAAIACGRYLWENRYSIFNNILNVGIVVLIFAGIIKLFLWCIRNIFR